MTPVAVAKNLPQRREDGLLPTVLFRRVFISGVDHYVVFDPRRMRFALAERMESLGIAAAICLAMIAGPLYGLKCLTSSPGTLRKTQTPSVIGSKG